MAGGGRTERGSRQRAAAASAVVPLPRTGGDRLDLARILPSGRSLLTAFGVVVAVVAAYWGARVTSVFAVDRVEVRGAPPDVAREVRAVTRRTVGSSLLAVDTDEIEGKVRLLPSVIAASVDRAFPHTLVVKVAAEHPVGVARRGDTAWLVTGSGHVIRALDPRAEPALPRIWLPSKLSIGVGGTLPSTYEPAARALGSLREVGFPAHVKGVRTEEGELTLALSNGRQILLGEPRDIPLKLAVAGQVLRHLDGSFAYLDLTVPERPVASVNPQPSG
jgi:POTRA domain, FtsQ-type/Cell division protein FtsQ